MRSCRRFSFVAGARDDLNMGLIFKFYSAIEWTEIRGGPQAENKFQQNIEARGRAVGDMQKEKRNAIVMARHWMKRACAVQHRSAATVCSAVSAASAAAAIANACLSELAGDESSG